MGKSWCRFLYGLIFKMQCGMRFVFHLLFCANFILHKWIDTFFNSKFSSYLNDFFETKTFLISNGIHFRLHKTSFWMPANLMMKQSDDGIINELIMILKLTCTTNFFNWITRIYYWKVLRTENGELNVKLHITNSPSICNMKRRKRWWLTNISTEFAHRMWKRIWIFVIKRFAGYISHSS